MFRFERPQETIQIGGLTIGGQPGEFPTVLIGSIFYDRHRIVEDPRKGKFDAEQGLELIQQLEEISEKTGNPFMLDVVGNTPEALKKYIDFVAENCNVPFLVDSSSVHTRLQAMKYAIDIGLRGRSIYNSIDYHTDEEELSFVTEIGVESAVVMAFNPRDLRPEGRLELLTGSDENVGLVEKTRKAGIEKLLVDAAVLDLPSIGLSARTILLVKEHLGLPCGCAPSNAVSSWERCKEDYGEIVFKSCRASANAMPIYFGADYILFGPISYANEVFPVCAMADALVAYTSRHLGTNMQTPNHPLRRIF